VDLYLKPSNQECPDINLKTLTDFPQFIGFCRAAWQDFSRRYTRFELDGKFDRIIADIDPHWFWLLFGENDCLCATLPSLDKGDTESQSDLRRKR